MSALDEVLEELADRVAAKVLAKLAAPTSHYGTGKAATLPPGKSKHWARRNLKLVDGARRVGRDWVVSIDDYEAWLTKKDTERQAGKSHGDARQSGVRLASNDEPSVAALVESSLLGSGLRRVRGAR